MHSITVANRYNLYTWICHLALPLWLGNNSRNEKQKGKTQSLKRKFETKPKQFHEKKRRNKTKEIRKTIIKYEIQLGILQKLTLFPNQTPLSQLYSRYDIQTLPKNDHRSLSHTKDKVTDLTLAKRFQESPSSVFHDLMTPWPLITRTVTPALTAPDQLFFHSRMKWMRIEWN